MPLLPNCRPRLLGLLLPIHRTEDPRVADVVIQNPILNSAFEEPTRHFAFSDEGITDEVVDSRRVSSYFMPTAAAKKHGKARLQPRRARASGPRSNVKPPWQTPDHLSPEWRNHRTRRGAN